MNKIGLNIEKMEKIIKKYVVEEYTKKPSLRKSYYLKSYYKPPCYVGLLFAQEAKEAKIQLYIPYNVCCCVRAIRYDINGFRWLLFKLYLDLKTIMIQCPNMTFLNVYSNLGQRCFETTKVNDVLCIMVDRTK